MMMKCYLEIEVPVRYDALWFKELRDACKGVDVRWQRAWHHITMAFLDEMPVGVDFRGILDQHLKHYQVPKLTFDKVDSFRTKSGMHIIYLSVTHVPKDFEAIVQAIRNDFETAGCKMQSAFKLHVTLGRVTDAAINVRALQRITALALIHILRCRRSYACSYTRSPHHPKQTKTRSIPERES